MAALLCRIWPDSDLCPSAWLPILVADSHTGYMPPVSVSTPHTPAQDPLTVQCSHWTCVCARESAVQLPCLCLFVCFSVCLCMHRHVFVCMCVCVCVLLHSWSHVCDDGTSSQVIMHLLRKCCQIMLTLKPGGPLCSERGDECEGMECVCTLCIWATSPLSNNSTHQKLKLGGCSRCLHE